jgi:hypothetical protein
VDFLAGVSCFVSVFDEVGGGFEDMPTEDLPAALAAVERDLEADMAASRGDAIAGRERVIRHAQAEQLKEINGLYEDRMRVIGARQRGVRCTKVGLPATDRLTLLHGASRHGVGMT